jgi:hypothetical protein
MQLNEYYQLSDDELNTRLKYFNGVVALPILGSHYVNPSALFAKLFEVVPKIIAKNKNMYGLLMFI